MHCPFCRSTDTRVLDSRVAEDGSAIRRRRTCPACEKRFTTVEQMQLTVLKRNGCSEPFNRDKAVAGVRENMEALRFNVAIAKLTELNNFLTSHFSDGAVPEEAELPVSAGPSSG